MMMPVAPCCPLRSPVEQHKQAATMTAEVQRDLHVTSSGRMFVPFVLQCLLPTPVQRKNPFAAKQDKSQQQDTHRQPFSERERKFPTWKGGGGTLGHSFIGLDTGLQNPPSFLLPPLPLTSLVVIFCLGSLLLLSQPCPPHCLCPGPAEGHCR